MLVIKLQKICKIIIPVLIPFEQKPVHNIRIPVALRNFCFAQQNDMMQCLDSQFTKHGRVVFLMKQGIALLDDVI